MDDEIEEILNGGYFHNKKPCKSKTSENTKLVINNKISKIMKESLKAKILANIIMQESTNKESSIKKKSKGILKIRKSANLA